jgi:uncharacterized membrane protein
VIFLTILVIATLVAALVQRRDGPRTWARNGLAAAFVVAGVAHLVDPTPFEQHLPGWVPAAPALVYATGVAEIVLGVLLAAWHHQRALMGTVTATYLVAVFPANAYVAIAGVDVDGQPGGAYPWIRLPFQVLFIAWALWSTRVDAPLGANRTRAERLPAAGHQESVASP